MNHLTKTIGRRVRAAREAAGLTQADVGDSLNLSPDAVSKIELGQSNLTLANLEKLPAILGRPIAYFLGIEVPKLSDEESEVIHLYRALSDEARRLARAALHAWLNMPPPPAPPPQIKTITEPPAPPPGVDPVLFERVEKVMSLLTPEERYLLGKMILDRRAARLGANNEGVEAETLNSQ